ncbi:sulfite exporter TauE/SafE family protein [Pelagibacterium montanilacus]|uniref:sulfite exporter TauE/SafE family protein n=1 Tax=Pelagibacterium montanilacus TaxID=2185280 RepID=UPI001FEBDC51|nr:sulfite exporter TauE/SafE family protein [Pelagibacterium montanilacus]
MAFISTIDWPVIVLAILAVIAAGAVQGSTGFGFNMVAAPVLALIDPAFVPVPMLLLALFVCIVGAIRERSEIDRKGLTASLSGRVAASILAVLCLGLVDQAAYSTLFAVLVLIAVALNLLGLKVDANPRNLFIAGGVSGFMGTLTSIGAPPMAMVYQNAKGPVMRATLSAFFVFGAIISLIALAIGGQVTWTGIGLGLLLLPFAMIGFVFSNWGRLLVDKGKVRIVVLSVSALSAVLLIVREFVF